MDTPLVWSCDPLVTWCYIELQFWWIIELLIWLKIYRRFYIRLSNWTSGLSHFSDEACVWMRSITWSSEYCLSLSLCVSELTALWCLMQQILKCFSWEFWDLASDFMCLNCRCNDVWVIEYHETLWNLTEWVAFESDVKQLISILMLHSCVDGIVLMKYVLIARCQGTFHFLTNHN